jgi:hypothetical protein
MWEPRRLTAIWTFTAYHKDSLTLFYWYDCMIVNKAVTVLQTFSGRFYPPISTPIRVLMLAWSNYFKAGILSVYLEMCSLYNVRSCIIWRSTAVAEEPAASILEWKSKSRKELGWSRQETEQLLHLHHEDSCDMLPENQLTFKRLHIITPQKSSS